MNKNMKKKALVSSILTIALCFSVIAGATFALFTSNSEVNIAVTSGKVNLEAYIDETTLATSSLGVAQDAGKFAVGGTASFDKEADLTLTNIVPGDKATFKINVKNNSTVDIMYKITWTVDNADLNVLVVTSDGAALADLGWTEWKAADAGTNKVLPVEIELPMDVMGDDYEGKEAEVTFAVEAIQANAVVENIETLDQLVAAVEAGADEIKLTDDFTLETPLDITNDVVIDLADNELTGNLVVSEDAELVLKNGDVKSTDPSVSAIQLNGGNATLDNVLISSARHGVRVEGGTLVINGGTYTVDPTSAKTQHAINVGGASEPSKLIINGGTFIGPRGTIADSGAAVNVQSNATAIINGGDFSGGKNTTISGAVDVITINGGTFDQDPSKFVKTNEGYKVTSNNGTWTVSYDLKNIIANANGETVELPVDVKYNTSINTDTSLNLNGNTFEATSSITLGNNADLAMTGGNYEVNGTSGHVDVRPTTAEGSVVIFEDVDFSFNKLSRTNGPSTDRLGSVVEVCATAADAKTVIVFKNCTFDNAKVLLEGLSGKTGEVEATFDGCTFNALTWSAPINVQNYVKGTLIVKNCTFNIEATSSTASAISISSSTDTSIALTAENNTINAIAATPYTYDAAAGEDETYNVKVNGTPANIKFVSISGTTSTANVTGTTATGIAVQ